MKIPAIFAMCALILSSFALAADMKSDVIGVAVDMTIKDTFETTLDGTELVEGYPDHKLPPDEGFTAKLFGFDKKELYTFKFPVEFWFYDNPTVLKEKPALIIFPYYRNGKEVKIYDKNNTLRLTVDLSQFATCNQNKVCNADIGEDETLCPEDCKAGESVAEMPAAEEVTEETPAEQSTLPTVWIIALLAVILAAIFMGILKTRKKE